MSTYSIGLIGLPDVRDALTELGVDVVSGETFPDASRNIRDATQHSSVLPILVEDHKQLGLPQLLSRISEDSRIVVVRTHEPVLEDSWESIPIESSLGEYLRAAGIADPDPSLDSITVDSAGKVRFDASEHSSAPAPTPPPAEEADWLSDEDEPTPPPSARSASPAPRDTPAPLSAISDWLSDEEIEPDPVPTAAPAPAPPSALGDGLDDDEDFDGFFTTAPSPAPALSTPGRRRAGAAPDAPRDPQPELAPVPVPQRETDPELETAPAASPPAPHSRRRIEVPSFDEPEAADPIQADAFLDRDLLDDLSEEAPQIEDDFDDFDVESALGTVAATSPAAARRARSALGIVLAVMAGKGGVGKTTLTLSIAQAAAEIGDLRVCVIDANRGQGDLGLHLRVRKSDLPSLYDAVTIGDLEAAIISPDQIAAARQNLGDRIAFSFVQAPRPVPDGDIAQEIAAVRPEHYTEIIRIAREQFDLVVIDTQITEALDTTGIIDKGIGPVLKKGAYVLGIVELTTAGVENLLTAFSHLRQLGADRSRILSIANRAKPDIHDFGRLPALLGRESTWRGAIHYDERIFDDMAARHVPYNVPTLRPLVLDILHAVTGMPEFSDQPVSAESTKVPWWKRWYTR